MDDLNLLINTMQILSPTQVANVHRILGSVATPEEARRVVNEAPLPSVIYLPGPTPEASCPAQ